MVISNLKIGTSYFFIPLKEFAKENIRYLKDDGEICGVKDYHKLSEDVPNKILQSMGLICEVNLLDNDGKKYFRIDVEKYPFPVSYHGKYYKRSGSTTQEVVGNELDKMILAVQGRTWDCKLPHN